MTRREALINAINSFNGAADGNAKHKEIIKIYNEYITSGKGTGSRYLMRLSDAWCAATVSAAAIISNNADIIPVECSCTRQINLLRKMGCYDENDNRRPAVGELVYYNWEGKTSPSDVSNHVGIVIAVDLAANKFTVREGNYNGKCQTRTIPVGWKYIHGFGVPKFGDEQKTEEKVYIVKPGDTLSKIARMYGTDYKTLAAKNNIANPNLIRPGQKILI